MHNFNNKMYFLEKSYIICKFDLCVIVKILIKLLLSQGLLISIWNTNEKEIFQNINTDIYNENAEFMKSLPPVLGYPHMYVSNANGKMLLSKDTAELLSGNNYSRENWLDFLEKWSLEDNQSISSKVPSNQSSTVE